MSASSEPGTSALSTRLSVATSPCWICSKMSSSLTPLLVTAASRPTLVTRCQLLAGLADQAGHLLVGGHRNSSPAFGTDDRPSTCTGVDGPASLTSDAVSSIRARTRPQAAPATIGSPSRRVPPSTRIVATGPGPHRGWPRARHPSPARGLAAMGSSSMSATTSSVLEQVVDAQALQRRHLDDDRVATPSPRDQPLLGELREDALRIGVVLVDLVDGDHDGHLGGAGVVDRLDRLGHHAVVGRHDQHDDVGRLGPAGAHAVKAAWPGVSMKVTRWPFCSTW